MNANCIATPFPAAPQSPTYWASVHRRFGSFSATKFHWYVHRIFQLCKEASGDRRCSISVFTSAKNGEKPTSTRSIDVSYIAELMSNCETVSFRIQLLSNSPWLLTVEWNDRNPHTITICLLSQSDTADGIGEVVETLSHHLFAESNWLKRFWCFLTYKIQESPYLPPEKD